MKKLTQARLREVLDYNMDTGIFTWKDLGTNRVWKGMVAGAYASQGYRQIAIDGKKHYAHRLAWLWIYGYFPETEIDHINRDKADNRALNLREVSHQCNMRNCGLQEDNSSGITGVSWHSRVEKWQAYITSSGKRFHLGHFSTKVEAARVRWEAEIEHGFPGCNTTSTALLYLLAQEGCDG